MNDLSVVRCSDGVGEVRLGLVGPIIRPGRPESYEPVKLQVTIFFM